LLTLVDSVKTYSMTWRREQYHPDPIGRRTSRRGASGRLRSQRSRRPQPH
jgi:hypothetical protein